ncbi:hypothetical protein [Paenibacillus helianthi]|nr:hypothetical protein [Paenibacillus helianthi]
MFKYRGCSALSSLYILRQLPVLSSKNRKLPIMGLAVLLLPY